LLPYYHPYLALRRLEKIMANTLNFMPNFKFSRLTVFGGSSVPIWVCASNPWSICSACKNLKGHHSPPALRAEISLPEKSPFGWFNVSPYYFFVCGQKFTGLFWERGRNRCRSHFFPILDRSGDISIKIESCQKSLH